MALHRLRQDTTVQTGVVIRGREDECNLAYMETVPGRAWT